MSDSAPLTLTPECEKEIEETFKEIYASQKKSSSEFIIDFENVWKWLGFTSKGNAKRFLTKNSEENIDYQFFSLEKTNICSTENVLDVAKVGRQHQDIFLTVDCFKLMCMMAKTEQSKLVRKFYLNLEKRLRDGDLTLASEVVQNFDKNNNTKSNVILQTCENEIDVPLWANIWREQRNIQKTSGKNLRDAQRDIVSKMDVRLYAAIENMHNQAVLGFQGTTKQWKKENGIPDRVAVADCMDREQLDLRRLMSVRLIQLFSEIDDPTPQNLKSCASKLKDFVAKTSEGFNLNAYHPVVDDETGQKTYIAKKVHKLELAHKRSQKRIKTLERKQELLESKSQPTIAPVIAPVININNHNNE